MTKSETISEIRKLNPTASPSFLSEFPTPDLRNYLYRLVGHGPTSPVMPPIAGDAPASDSAVRRTG